MIRKIIFLTLLSLTFFILYPVQGDVLTHTFLFHQEKISAGEYLSYDQLFYPGCDLSAEPGHPQLPIYPGHILLPAGAEIKACRVENIEKIYLARTYQLWPVQKPQILSARGPFVRQAPEAAIYSSSDPYPAEPARLVHAGDSRAGRIAEIEVYPFQYVGASKQVIFNQAVTVEIEYDVKALIKNENRSEPLNASKISQLKQIYSGLIDNTRALHSVSFTKSKASGRLPDRDYEYVLITDESMVSAFQPLVDWKTRKGVPATIVTTQSIYQSYPGYDDAEKVRHFIQEAYQNWGILWLTLGGDTSYVPYRKCFVLDSGYGANDIPVDLYFSDLDGTWDLDGDHEYGEIEDNVDLYPDVYVGRISVASVAEATVYVNKLLVYEKSPPTDYEINMTFIGGVLWHNPFTDASISKEMIDEHYVPERFDPITKLYQTQGNMNEANFIASLNVGATIINHDDHGSYDGFGVGSWFDNGDADALTNAPRFGILFTISCQSGGYDKNCLGEHFIKNPNGGLIGFIGNSRYGWGSPGNPGYGYSDRYDHQFFATLFSEDIPHIGATLGIAKAYYASRSRWANVYRWCQFQTNLLGDPEMPIWTDIPQNLDLSFPGEIPPGESLFPVTVTHEGRPVPDARVCLQKGSDVYLYGITGDNGMVSFSVSPQATGTMSVTATAHNFLPFEGSALVMSSGDPYPVPIAYDIDDAAGNHDGFLNPGESVDLVVTVTNFGAATASNVVGTLSSSDAMVTLTGSEAQLGSIPPGMTADGRFSFTLDESCGDGHVIYFDLGLEDELKAIWAYKISATACEPSLLLDGFIYSDEDTGNGNGMIDPGESVEVFFTICNKGRGIAYNTSVAVNENDPYASLTGSSFSLGDLPPGGIGTGSISLAVEAACPEPHNILLTLSLSCDRNQTSEDIELVVGHTGFFDDVESGTLGWAHSGDGDLWHIVSNRSHSISRSWYCGNDEGGGYNTNMNCTLLSQRIVLPNDPVLSFWTWYDLDLYGSDGIYVEIEKGADIEQLDFIGSGGALGHQTGFSQSGWVKESYDLSNYSPGDEIYIRFRFYSDNDASSEGLYLDDIAINNTNGDAITIILAGAGEGPQVPQSVRGFDLQGHFMPETDFSFSPIDGYGAKIEAGSIRGLDSDEILASHGPGPDLPPVVKGFDMHGQLIGSLQFVAYGIDRYGVNLGVGDLDRDGSDEIITGPGPGPVFGPHVRGWDFDHNAISPIPAVNFKAYNTQKWGVRVDVADIDGDGYDEILTGAGEGNTFGPHVRAFNFDASSVQAINGVNFFAYNTRRYGVKVAGGDLDGDGYDEILTAPGPGPMFGPNIRGWNYDNGTTPDGKAGPMGDVNFLAYNRSIKLGAEVTACDIDKDGYAEILTGPGPGPTYGSHLRGWNYDAHAIVPFPALNFFAFGQEIRYGLHVCAGTFRY